MSINQLILRNLKKNIKNYYLYIFALILVSLFTSLLLPFSMTQHMEDQGTIKGGAAIRSRLRPACCNRLRLFLYANNIFIKRQK